MNELREQVIDQVAMARFINEETDDMRNLNLTSDELKHILYHELTEKKSAWEKPDKIDKITPLKILIASKLLLDKWSSSYTIASFNTIKKNIVSTPEGDSFTTVVELKKRGLMKLFSQKSNRTENLDFIVTKTIKEMVTNQSPEK